MDTQHSPKKLIESPLYDKSKNEITADTKLLDTILEGVTFSIASNPQEYPLVDDYGTRTVKCKGAGDVLDLVVFFKELDDHLILVNIEIDPDAIPF